MLKKPTIMKRDTSWAKFTAISRQVAPALLVGISAGYCRRVLVGLSGMIIPQMGMYIISEMAVVYGTPCAIPPRNCNSMCLQHMQ
jgi:hypothetical protein